MSETKHTPGPWTASADRICGGLRIRIRAPERPLGQAKTPYSPIVAEVAPDWGISDAEAAASASLIAAAPELLETLSDVADELDAYGAVERGYDDEGRPDPADAYRFSASDIVALVERMRAVIAKVEGRA